VSGGDRTGSSTQVPVVRHAWAPMATSYHARHLMSSFPKVPALAAPTQYQKPPGEAAGSSRASQTGGGGVRRRNGLTGGEVLSAHDYRDEGVC
jgi:hypothetical protein